MAKAKALVDLGDTDLLEQLADQKEELFNLRFQFATGQLDSSARLTEVKRGIARMLTELRAREIADAEAFSEREAEIEVEAESEDNADV